MLETDVRHAAEDEAEQIVIREQCRRHSLGEDVEGGSPLRMAH